MSGTILDSGDIAVNKTHQENLVLKSSHSSMYKGWQKLHNEQRLQAQNLKMVVSKAETGRREENIYIYLNDVSWKDLTKKVNSVWWS